MSADLLVLSRRLRGPLSDVFAAWTSPSFMRKWLAPGPCRVIACEADVRSGGAFHIGTAAPDGTRHNITGRYLCIVRETRLDMTWLYKGPIALLDSIETILEVRLAPIDQNATLLTLTQRRFTETAVRDAFAADWPSCFDKLEAELGRVSDRGRMH